MKKLLYFPTFVLLLLWTFGCSGQPTESGSNSSGANLIDDFGGYTASSEKPAFGDSELLDEANQEIVFNDPILVDPLANDIITHPNVGVFHLLAVWGKLRFDSTSTNITNWDGSVIISRGAEVVRRTIRFEPGQDYVKHRTDRKVIEWVSATTVHNDGIAIKIFIPPAPLRLDTTIVTDSLGNELKVIDTLPAEPVSVSFVAGEFSRKFSLEELAALDTVIELSNGNAIALHGAQSHPQACPHGFMRGHWGYNEDGQGVFRGFWVSPLGEITGYLKGHFGTNDEGGRLFFGKWISAKGEFTGFVRGHWAPINNDTLTDHLTHRRNGVFHGAIFSQSRNMIGKLKGRYFESDRIDGGFFQGVWQIGCDHPNDRDSLRDSGKIFPDGF